MNWNNEKLLLGGRDRESAMGELSRKKDRVGNNFAGSIRHTLRRRQQQQQQRCNKCLTFNMIKQIMCLAYEWPRSPFFFSLFSLASLTRPKKNVDRTWRHQKAIFDALFAILWFSPRFSTPLVLFCPPFLAAASRSDGYKRPISEQIWFWKMPSPKPSRNEIESTLALFGISQLNASVPSCVAQW